jgi:C4-dicarboxylate-specific signal transduction histidine kinase
MTEALIALAYLAVPVALIYFIVKRRGATRDLEREVSERLRAENALRAARDELEQTVELRTAELQRTNQTLQQEIVERERAEQSLLREKAFSDFALDALPEVFYLFDQDGRFLRWNRLFEVETK